MPDNHHLKILQLLEANPHLSQREASDTLGLSLGKVNYIINALVEKGMVKMRNFKNNKNKSTYSYLLTPQGIEEKIKLTYHFYEVKKREYEELKREIERMEDIESEPALREKGV